MVAGSNDRVENFSIDSDHAFTTFTIGCIADGLAPTTNSIRSVVSSRWTVVAIVHRISPMMVSAISRVGRLISHRGCRRRHRGVITTGSGEGAVPTNRAMSLVSC